MLKPKYNGFDGDLVVGVLFVEIFTDVVFV